MKWHRVLSFAATDKNSIPDFSIREITIEVRKVCLVKLPEGFYACDAVCPHAGGPLSAGFIDEHNRIVCPLHRYAFDLRTGKCPEGDNIFTYPVKEDENGVWIGIIEKRRCWFW